MKFCKFFAITFVLLSTVCSVGFAQQDDVQSYINGERTKYFTKDHPKAKGINISVEYPSSWTPAEGERPNIVQKFSGDSSDGITRMFLIIIKDTPKFLSLLPADEMAKEAFSDEALHEMVPPGGSFINGEMTKYDGQTGAWMIYSITSERAGMTMKMYTLQHMFFYKGKMVAVQCMVGGLEQMKDGLYGEFNKYLLLFQQIGNNIVIHDKWQGSGTRQDSSPMELLYGSLWWVTIIVSFLLTWGLGLIPPIIIRYAIVRRPLTKKWAIGVVAILWMFNIALFTALGSESKTHAALFLVAWVSYIILKKEKKEKTPKEVNKA